MQYILSKGANSDNNQKILIAICGLGEPNGEIKKNGCVRNLEILNKTAPKNSEIYIKIFCYDDLDLHEFNRFKNCEITREPGIIGQFIYKYLSPEKISGYDNLFLMLDDIQLQDNVNLEDMIQIQKNCQFDILSPSATEDSKISHNGFMKIRKDIPKNTLLILNFLEFFSYLFNLNNPESYKKWHSLINKNTKWMWGIDMVLSPILKMKLGLLNNMNFKHTQHGGSYTNDAHEEIRALESKFGQKVLHELEILEALLITV